MKKVLSILSLIAILGVTTPAFAGPGGHDGPKGHGGSRVHGGGHRIHAGAHHRHHHAHHIRPHGGVVIRTGYYPRHSYWSHYGHGYWGNPWCNYRLGCYPYHGFGMHFPMGGASLSIGF